MARASRTPPTPADAPLPAPPDTSANANMGAKTSRTATLRVSPAFFLLQSLLIRNMAAAKVPTTDIASALKVDRSYVIRLAQDGVTLAPTNEREQAILALASDDAHRVRIQNLGLKGLLGGEDLGVTLAGGERPKLGTKEERAQARAERAAKAPALPLPEPKPAKVKKVKEAAAPAPKPAKAKKTKAPAEPAAPVPEPKPTRAKKGTAKPPVPTDEPTADDILGNL